MPMSAMGSFPTPPVVLTFAASDPSGGAGVQADLITLSALGCHALSALTALTVQDTRGVAEIRPLDAALLERQARAVLEDIRVDAFKIGVLGSLENIHAVARILVDYPDVPVVLDPVLASGRGDALSDESMPAALRDTLLPLARVVTPNTLEARRLAKETKANAEDETALSLDECARRLLARGCEYVLLTGTHENPNDSSDPATVVNRLFGQDGAAQNIVCKRLPGSYHGSGCTLASALAAGLAGGLPVSDAAVRALEFTWRSLDKAFRLGKGQFIPNRIAV